MAGLGRTQRPEGTGASATAVDEEEDEDTDVASSEAGGEALAADAWGGLKATDDVVAAGSSGVR